MHGPVHVAYPVQAEPGAGKQSGCCQGREEGRRGVGADGLGAPSRGDGNGLESHSGDGCSTL